jgi:CheY-like chemotaxis protein
VEDPVADLPASLRGVRVLVVDDEPDAREVMAEALETCGATVLSASSVDDALRLLRPGHNRIDVLLSDIAMPDKDGYELIRTVRARSSGDLVNIPAIAVTARAGEDERQRALAAGFQMHLVKPLLPATLIRAVASLTKIEPASTGAASGGES